jgi:DNA-directed RNA polymerase sigma subunit (sigma70/sigma32)
VAQPLDKLQPIRAYVVRGRLDGQALVEVVERVGVSRERVRQLEADAIAELRHRLGPRRRLAELWQRALA